jgi:hypothetical protein
LSQNLNIGLLSGEVKLGNLVLKPSALDELRLPIDVKAGFLQSLVVKVRILSFHRMYILWGKFHVIVSQLPSCRSHSRRGRRP